MRILLKYAVLSSILILSISCKKEESSDDGTTPTTSGLPNVVLSSAVNASPTSIDLTAEVLDEGLSAVIGRGFCWSTSPDPTVNDNFSINAFGPGVFTQTATDLEPTTQYFFRAYATNGEGTIYSNEINITTDNPSIGMNYKGGYVVYVDASGQHGLVVSNTDIGNSEWGCAGTDIQAASSSSIGSGATNTQHILANCNQQGIAVKDCDNYGYGGYNDWFLPSIDELEMLRTNSSSIPGLTTTGQNAWYWSSTQLDDTFGRIVNFHQPGFTNFHKSTQGRVRAMRAF